MVDTEDLLLIPVWLQRLLELTGTFKILAEWLLNLHELRSAVISSPTWGTYNDPCNTIFGVAVLLDVLRDRGEDTWW
jgi:hypothetical protein